MSTAENREKLREKEEAQPTKSGVISKVALREEEPLAAPPVTRVEGGAWLIKGAYEHQVLKVGLRQLDERWPADGISSLPRGKDGSGIMLRERLFKQLLAGEMHLKSVPKSDVTTGQRDIIHLSLRQLLRLRVLHLDYTPSGCGADTVSTLGAGHEAFMSTLDSLLFERLGRKATERLKDPPVDNFHRIGREAVFFSAASAAVPEPNWWCWWMCLKRQVFFNTET